MGYVISVLDRQGWSRQTVRSSYKQQFIVYRGFTVISVFVNKRVDWKHVISCFHFSSLHLAVTTGFSIVC